MVPLALAPRRSPLYAASTPVLIHLGTLRPVLVTLRKPIAAWVSIDAPTLCASPGISLRTYLFDFFLRRYVASSDVLCSLPI